MNTFLFNTVEDYLASKASSAAGSIKTVLADTTQGLSRSAVSLIKNTGQTFIDAVNVIVEEKFGDIGDVLLAKSVTISGTAQIKYFWLKSAAQWSQVSGSLGSVSCSTDISQSTNHITSAGYSIVGVLIDRQGNDGLIMSHKSLGGIPWCRRSDYVQETQATWAIKFTNMPEIQIASTRRSITRSNAYASLGLDMRERLGDGYNQYSNPFPRSAWNAMMAAYQAGSETAGNADGGTTYDTSKNWTWKTEKVAATGLTGNTMKATFSFKTNAGTNTGYDPATWNFSFDKWYKDCLEIQNPSTKGVVYSSSAGSELSGRENTRRMLEFISTYNAANPSTPINNTASTNCAVACDQYYAITTDNATFGQHKWWLPNMAELTKATLRDKVLYAKGINLGGTYIWSSTQSSQYSAFNADTFSGYVISNYYNKCYELTVRAVSAYHFS